MPINRSLSPPDWHEIAAHIKDEKDEVDWCSEVGGRTRIGPGEPAKDCVKRIGTATAAEDYPMVQTGIPSLAAIVLAGGQSRRMGRDKALLQVDGQPMLARTCRIAAEVCDIVSVVTPWVDRYRPVLPGSIHLIQEPFPGGGRSAGPLMGFLQGLALQSAPWILLLACDLPGLQSAPLQSWAENLRTLPDGILAHAPRSPHGWEPLCGFYRRQCLPPLQAFVAGGDRSFQRWLDSIPVQAIKTDENAPLFNCNTPEDWTIFRDSVQKRLE